MGLKIILPDGLYRVTTKYLCAGFVVKNKEIIKIAPILKKNIRYWEKIAKRVEYE